MLWPQYRLKDRSLNLNPKIKGFKIINPLPSVFYSSSGIQISKRNTIIYGRPGQKVWREIVILERD